jgi:hypothetical protein
MDKDKNDKPRVTIDYFLSGKDQPSRLVVYGPNNHVVYEHALGSLKPQLDAMFDGKPIGIEINVDTSQARAELEAGQSLGHPALPLVFSVNEKPAETPKPPKPREVGEKLIAAAFKGGPHEQVMLLEEARAWIELAHKTEEKPAGTEQVGEALRKILRDTERSQGKAGE